MSTVEMDLKDIKKCRAIVSFGPATPTSGMKPGEYFQVTIDPSLVSPNGQYIRFGIHKDDEIVGWQRVEALTVCEILGEYAKDGSYPVVETYSEYLQMMVIE